LKFPYYFKLKKFNF